MLHLGKLNTLEIERESPHGLYLNDEIGNEVLLPNKFVTQEMEFGEDIEVFIASKPKGKSQILAIFDFLELFFQAKDFNGCWCIKTVSEISSDNEIIRNEIQKQKNAFIQVITRLVTNNIENIKNAKDRCEANLKCDTVGASCKPDCTIHQPITP